MIKRDPFSFDDEAKETYRAPVENLAELEKFQGDIQSRCGRSFMQSALQSRSYYVANGERIIAVMQEQILAWKQKLRRSTTPM
jgi:hypothetical protein